MIEKIKTLIREKDTCVLATVSDNKPHCSLMLYTTDADCREIYMVTDKKTKKFDNLLRNSSVSLLIDTRAGDVSSTVKGITSSLTIIGTYQKFENEEKRELIREQFLKRHPALKEFLDDPDTIIIAIHCNSFQLLQGIRDSYFINIDGGGYEAK